MKHFKLIFTLVFFIGISNIILAQAPNVPLYHGSSGTLVPPPVADPQISETIWDIINESDCDLEIWVWFTLDGHGTKFIQRSVPAHSNVTISSDDIVALYELTSATDITHSSISIKGDLNGPNIGEGYPGENTRKENTDIESGCNCVHMEWNVSAKTIVFSNC